MSDVQSTKLFVRSHGCAASKNAKCTPEYVSWAKIKQRCFNQNCLQYKRYGGRGITMCQRWLTFQNFLADVGHRPSLQHSIERIDNNKGYELGNVRWATKQEQARNRCNNVLITFQGKTLCLIEWAEKLGFTPDTLYHRVSRGWSIERTLLTPARRPPLALADQN